MERIEKTVFISYRRTNFPWALAIFQDLTHHGYDVFFDYDGIDSGDFEEVILSNIKARAHFLIVLTPSALERCMNPEDWLRREIEAALEHKRNVVPLLLEGFSFSSTIIASQLAGKLEALKHYNGVGVPSEYFAAAMDKLRTRFLSVPLRSVSHPAPAAAQTAAVQQAALAAAAPAVLERELTAQDWFERGYASKDLDENIRFYTEAIRLNPDYSNAYNNRGNARSAKGDLDGAIEDYNEAIRIKPDFLEAYNNRGSARYDKGDLDGAIEDYSEAIQIKPDYPEAYYNRGNARYDKGDLDDAIEDYNEAIRIEPDYAEAYNNRGSARDDKGDLDGAIEDYSEAIQIKTDYAEAYYNRARLLVATKPADAIADYRKYLQLGGGERDGDTAKVEQIIRGLEARVEASHVADDPGSA